MPRFEYKSYDRSGELLSGELDAADRPAALRALKERQLVPLTVASKSRTNEPWWNRELFQKKLMARRDLMRFTSEFAHLIAAKLRVDEALDIVALQPGATRHLKVFARRIRERVIEGAALWQALEAEADKLPVFYVSAIRAGERSGALSETLNDLASFLEVSGSERSRIFSAMIYPATLLFAAVIVLAIIVSVLLPTIMPLVKDSGSELPTILAALEALRSFVQANWLIGVLAASGLVGLHLYSYAKFPDWRKAIHALQLKLPAAGTLVQHINVARFSHTLSLLLRNGVPLLEALPTAIETVSNSSMKSALAGAVPALREGQTLQLALARTASLPEAALRLVAVGEQTATLSDMLGKTAELYRASVKRRLDRWATMIAPVMTVVIGLFVGGLVLSIMSAIVSINDLTIR